MTKVFAALVEAIEANGITGHDAYDLANHADKSKLLYASPEEIKEAGKEIASEEIALREALE